MACANLSPRSVVTTRRHGNSTTTDSSVATLSLIFLLAWKTKVPLKPDLFYVYCQQAGRSRSRNAGLLKDLQGPWERSGEAGRVGPLLYSPQGAVGAEPVLQDPSDLGVLSAVNT